MNRRFEQVACPIYRERLGSTAHQLVLESDEPRRLAGWAYKTALVVDFTTRGRSSVGGDAFRVFRRRGLPPSGTRISVRWTPKRRLSYRPDQTNGDGFGRLVADQLVFLIRPDHVAPDPHFVALWPEPGPTSVPLRPDAPVGASST